MQMVTALGFLPFIGFGLWLLFAPATFVRFNFWLHSGRIRANSFPSFRVIRVLGTVWLVALLLMAFWT